MGFQAASQEQQQRHAELSLAQRQRMEMELHQQKLRHADEQHQARLKQIAQSQKNQSTGGQNARRAA